MSQSPGLAGKNVPVLKDTGSHHVQMSGLEAAYLPTCATGSNAWSNAGTTGPWWFTVIGESGATITLTSDQMFHPGGFSCWHGAEAWAMLFRVFLGRCSGQRNLQLDIRLCYPAQRIAQHGGDVQPEGFVCL